MSAIEKTEKATGKSIDAVLGFAAQNGMDDDEAFALVKKRGWPLVRSLVVWYYHNVQRRATRLIEQRVDIALEVAETSQDRVSARGELAGETFCLKDGTSVSWFDATEDQHRSRAAWQRELAGQATADALRHEAVAEEIKAAGVKCLRDLEKKGGRR